MIKALLKEFGFSWVFNRSLYSIKLKLMKALPGFDKLFEHDVVVKRIDIFDLDVKQIEGFLENIPQNNKEEIIIIADNAIKGKILGFSSIELDYGYPINWHLNPITGIEVDNTIKWYKIPDFDPERGDIKTIWEASRFTHFFYFIRAYMITKNRKYYVAFSNQLDEWLQANDYFYGANYKCGQEATLRMISVLIAYSVFQYYGLITKKDEKNIIQLLKDSYKKVLSNFFYAHKCIKNNHTLSEITGLIIGAWACDDRKRLDKAYDLLEKEIQNQFFVDGGYVQFSFNYQRFALQLMAFVMSISKKTKRDLSKQSKVLIRNSAYLLYQMQDISGDVPNYGSNDGALIFPITSCNYRDFRPIINTIFALTDKKRVYKPGNYDEELLWFIGDCEDLENISFSDIHKMPVALDKSGLYSLRHKEGFLMTILQDYKTRPAQMDQLHIDLWHKGINVFCDSGTYSYATNIGSEMSLTSAHNTAKLPGIEQMKKHGPFLIYDWTELESVEHSENQFKGTMVSKNGYKHTRNIELTDYGYLIIDEVIGKGEYCKFLFHTPCDVGINDKGFELYYKDQLVCRVITDGDLEIEKAYRSLYYLKKESINCVVVNGKIDRNKCNIKFKIELCN